MLKWQMRCRDCGKISKYRLKSHAEMHAQIHSQAYGHMAEVEKASKN